MFRFQANFILLSMHFEHDKGIYCFIYHLEYGFCHNLKILMFGYSDFGISTELSFIQKYWYNMTIKMSMMAAVDHDFYEIFLQVNKSYSLADWKSDLKKVLKRSGADGKQVRNFQLHRRCIISNVRKFIRHFTSMKRA